MKIVVALLYINMSCIIYRAVISKGYISVDAPVIAQTWLLTNIRMHHPSQVYSRQIKMSRYMRMNMDKSMTTAGESWVASFLPEENRSRETLFCLLFFITSLICARFVCRKPYTYVKEKQTSCCQCQMWRASQEDPISEIEMWNLNW